MDHSPQVLLNVLVKQFYQIALREVPNDMGLSLIDSPDDADAVFMAPDVFHKCFGNIDFLGRSRLNTDGELWRHRRGLTHATLNDAGKPNFRQHIFNRYAARFDQISELTPNHFHRAADEAAMAVFLDAFGCQTDPAELVSFLEHIQPLIVELQASSWFRLASQSTPDLQRRAEQAVRQFEDLLMSDPETAALLTRITERMEGGSRLDATEEVLMGAFAGIESTTSAIRWLFNRLGINDRVQERVAADLDKAVPERRYFDCFIKETLRYFPPIPFVARLATQDFELPGRSVKKGDRVVVSIIGLHMNETAWQDPYIFDSARPEFMGDEYNRKCFIPFLKGPRTCGGMRLAEIELAAALEALLKRFRVRNSDPKINIDYALVSRPAQSDPLIYSRI